MTDARRVLDRTMTRHEVQRAISDALSGLTAELLWQLKAAGVPEPVTEFPFAKAIGRRWRFDIAWPDRMLAAEVDGGTWIGGRHVTGSGVEQDAEKVSEAAALGWRVLRITGKMIDDGRALSLLERALTVRA